MVGTVSPDGVPTLLLSVAGQTWTAVIDTGFNGDLELPDVLRLALHARFDSQTCSVLAAGQVVVEDLYLVDFPFDGQTVEAEATFAPVGEILIGTQLLSQYRLEIDFAARTVLLTRVAGNP